MIAFLTGIGIVLLVVLAIKFVFDLIGMIIDFFS